MYVSFWLWRQVSEKLVGGFMHFHGHNLYSVIVVVARLYCLEFSLWDISYETCW